MKFIQKLRHPKRKRKRCKPTSTNQPLSDCSDEDRLPEQEFSELSFAQAVRPSHKNSWRKDGYRWKQNKINLGKARDALRKIVTAAGKRRSTRRKNNRANKVAIPLATSATSSPQPISRKCEFSINHVDVDRKYTHNLISPSKTSSTESTAMLTEESATIEEYSSIHDDLRRFALANSRRILVLLVCPESHRLEIVPVDFRDSTTRVEDVLPSLTDSIENKFLSSKSYVGLCWPRSGKELINCIKISEHYVDENEILCAIPTGMTGAQCRDLAQPLLGDLKTYTRLSRALCFENMREEVLEDIERRISIVEHSRKVSKQAFDGVKPLVILSGKINDPSSYTRLPLRESTIPLECPTEDFLISSRNVEETEIAQLEQAIEEDKNRAKENTGHGWLLKSCQMNNLTCYYLLVFCSLVFVTMYTYFASDFLYEVFNYMLRRFCLPRKNIIVVLCSVLMTLFSGKVVMM